MKEKTFFTRSDFYQEFNASQNQFLYFIIGLDVAAIAFSLSKIEANEFSWPLLFAASSLLAWLISAWMGIRFTQTKMGGLIQEMQALDITEDETNIIQREKKLAQLTNEAEKGKTKMQRQFDTMYYLFFGGVLCFICFEVAIFLKR